MRDRLILISLGALLPAFTLAQTPDWTKINDEAMRHFQALVRIDSTDPPGNETKVAEYVKKVLDADGIPATLVAKDPARANLIARLKGNGSKRPLLIMGHSDTVRVDPSKWTFPSVQRYPARRLRLRPRHARRQERSAGRHDDDGDAEAIATFRSTAT